MRRREFISLVGAMTAARPLVTRAHSTGIKRSGVLMSAAQFSHGYRKSIIISHKTTGTCRLTPEEFHTAYPKLRAWIQKTLEFYEEEREGGCCNALCAPATIFRREFARDRKIHSYRSPADATPVSDGAQPVCCLRTRRFQRNYLSKQVFHQTDGGD